MSDQENNATFISYAQALLELADARGQTSQVAEEVAQVAGIFNDNKTFRTYAGDPSVSVVEREHKLQSIFGGQVSATLLSTMKVLNLKGRLVDFPGIAAAFKKVLDDRAGKIDVAVTVAQPLTDHELEDVRQRVSSALKKDARVTQQVDNSIIGGLILRIGDRLIDGSVKSQLNSIKQKLLAASPV